MDGIFTDSERKNKTAKSVEWYTPKWIFDELAISFDVDPCSPGDVETSVPAATKYTLLDNGLKQIWRGTVWLNPPYSRETGLWIQKLIDHGTGIGLVFSRTDTKWCQAAMDTCTSMLFVRGRIDFVPGEENKHKKSRCGAGTVLFAFGRECAIALKRMAHRGIYIDQSNEIINYTGMPDRRIKT